MYKLSTELGYVNQYLKLSVGVIYQDDIPERRKISKFNVNGNDFLQIRIHPYLTLSYRNDVDRERWSSNKSVNLSAVDVFRFVKCTKEFSEQIQKATNLFVRNPNGYLQVNKELANRFSITVPLSFNKRIWIVPILVKDSDTNLDTEGIMMCFNVTTNYVTMTLLEFSFLISYLENVDMNTIGLQMITYAEVTKDMAFSKLDTLQTVQLPQLPQSEEGIRGFGLPNIPNQIPQI